MQRELLQKVNFPAWMQLSHVTFTLEPAANSAHFVPLMVVAAMYPKISGRSKRRPAYLLLSTHLISPLVTEVCL